MTAQDPRRGILLMILAMFLFASMDAASKLLVQHHAVAQILWIRYVFFAAFAYLWARRDTRTPGRALLMSPQPITQIVRSAFLVGEVFLFVLAFRFLTLAEVAAVAAMTPLIVTALSGPVLGETVGLRRWGAIIVGFGGMLVIVRPGLAGFEPALLLALMGSINLAIYQIMTKRVSERDPASTSLLYAGLVGLGLTSLVGPLAWSAPGWVGWALLLACGVLGTSAHLVLIKALEAAPASLLQPFFYTFFLWGVVMGIVVFGDIPDPATLIGGMIVILSGLYVWARDRSRTSDQASPRA